MLDINAIPPAGAAHEPEPLAKAHPAAHLVRTPVWTCDACKHKNPVTAPFCEKCPQ